MSESLTSAWNVGDGGAFARAFAEDADFVNIYATHVAGRDAVAQLHQTIFEGVYQGSVPQGPMAGDMHTLATAVLVREGSGWSIASFHNTREQAPPSVPKL